MARSPSLPAAALAVALLAALAPPASATCRGDKYRDCNAPIPYGTQVATSEPPVVHASTGFPAAQKVSNSPFCFVCMHARPS